jgi:Family of unknown function (DUF6152)
MSYKVLGMCVAFSMLVVDAPVLAHHAFEAEFDAGKPVKFTGVLTKVDWVNPHAYFHFDVKDASGKVISWQMQNGPPVLLRSNGLQRDKLPIGQTVSVEGYGAKDGTVGYGFITTMHLQNGSTILLIAPSQQSKGEQP